MKKLSRISSIAILIFLAVLSYFFYFDRLGEFTLRMWDESRNGINALEMMGNKNPLVTSYRGKPDMWNTKPPLLIWMSVLLFKMFGVSEYTFRIPSALAVSFVTLLIFIFSDRVLKDKWVGVLGSLILLTSYGFADNHIGRTGDYDALLTLWVVCAVMTTFIYTQKWKQSYLTATTAFWTLAVMTKGIAGLLMIPGIIVYLLISRKMKKLVIKKEFRRHALVFALVVGGYYLGREVLNHGYLRTVWVEEFFNRTVENNEKGTNAFLYYWQWAVNMRFQHWTKFVPFTIASYVVLKSKTKKEWLVLSYIITIVYYVIISTTQTKHLWYDAQLYPFVSLLLSIFFVSAIRKIPFPIWLIPTFALTFYLQRYLRTNLAYIQRPDTEMNNPCYKFGYFLRDHNFDRKGVIGVYEDEHHCMPFTFYMKKEGMQVKDIGNIAVGDKVLICDDTTTNSLNRHYESEKILEGNEGCVIYNVVDDL